jgi:hypothetical protein
VTIVTPRLVPKIRRLDVFLECLPESFKEDWLAAFLEFPEPHNGLRSMEDYYVPLSRTSNDLADKTANLEAGSSKERSSENKR